MPEKEKKFYHKKRGNKSGFWFFKTSLKIFGLSGTYGLLYLICPYYLIFDRAVFSTSMAYINRRYQDCSFLRKIYYAYKLLINQGKSLIDRYYIISGQGQFDVDVHNSENVKSLFEDPEKGFILLMAHVGNWQVIMAVLEKSGKTIHLVMRPEDNIAVKNTLKVDCERERIKIISPEEFLGSAIKITNAINHGDIVSIMGDRAYDFDSVEVDFLGDKARFPYGAFSIGAAVGCPVVVMLSAKVSTKKYRAYSCKVFQPHYRSRKEKRQQIKGWVQEFARNLEDYVIKYPLQWFVFHDIWTG